MKNSVNSFSNKRQLKKIDRIANLIEGLADVFAAKSDAELTAYTQILKNRLAEGATTDDLLPEAFALVREAATRVLGMRHFHVQLMGGIALYQGRIAEMCTGEGKTLVATLPAYLLALEGNGVHIVTVNEYLAMRDSEWMGQVYRFLGLSVGVIYSQQPRDEKKEMYLCDITYGTNNEFGFDYLRDNMVKRKEDKVQRELRYALVDEVDSILIDEARTPLIISGPTNESNEEYVKANRFVRKLIAPTQTQVHEESKMAKIARAIGGEEGAEEDGDYAIDEKENTIRLTDSGVAKAEAFYGLENLSDAENVQLLHIINQALVANYLKKRDVDYVVNDGEVIIVDEFTGRLMIGRRYSEGLHQAIEAKEGLAVRNESKTYATITFQNYFRLYRRLSGMTGTAKTEEQEFQNIYGLDVVCIPTNLPVKRIDENDRLYKTKKGKITAIVEEIRACHEKGQPVLVGTINVEKSELLSDELRRAKIPHNVLNAKNHEKEAEIIAQAGKKGMVTIATNMAGRGTDILLGGNPAFAARVKLAELGYPSDLIAEVSNVLVTPAEDAEAYQTAKAEYDKYYALFKKDADANKAEVIALGGLRIIGTERHESRRIDNQLRGRSGRQGDPGSSVFFLSMEDDLLRIFGGETVFNIADRLDLPEDMPITVKMLTNQIERAQQRIEDRNYSIRKHVLAYDDVMNKQREVIYGEREKVLNGVDIHEEILKMIPEVVADAVMEVVDYSEDFRQWDYAKINAYLEARILPVGTNAVDEVLAAELNMDHVIDGVLDKVLAAYQAKVGDFNARCAELIAAGQMPAGFSFAFIERNVMLSVVDSNWIDHIDDMDALRKGIGLRQIGQRDPVISYQQEGYEMFEAMIANIRSTVVTELLKFDRVPAPNPAKVETKTKLHDYPENLVTNDQGQAVRKEAKIGRNSPCPCGSGKKYKNCCGAPGAVKKF